MLGWLLDPSVGQFVLLLPFFTAFMVVDVPDLFISIHSPITPWKVDSLLNPNAQFLEFILFTHRQTQVNINQCRKLQSATKLL